MVHHTLKGCPHISDAEYLAKMKSRCLINERGCWVWQGFVQKSRGMEHLWPEYGYGEMAYRGGKKRVHRLAWSLTRGPIPAGMVAMHTCDNTRCCNPDHVKLGTPKENSRDASIKGRSDRQWQTHCKRGHEFTEANTYYSRGHAGRQCRTCIRLRNRGLLQPAPRLLPQM